MLPESSKPFPRSVPSAFALPAALSSTGATASIAHKSLVFMVFVPQRVFDRPMSRLTAVTSDTSTNRANFSCPDKQCLRAYMHHIQANLRLRNPESTKVEHAC